ncbi:MAG TPA: clostripain-related cysteine peptidase [Ruminiclostridium sp.]|nr:clostripain-related cysteine peptidase [Ruminiclostridium sp.]
MTYNEDWTVLIYANGHNDLETVINNQFHALINSVLPGNINIAVELARCSHQKPPEEKNCPQDGLYGVNRYCVKECETFLLEELEDMSMADPSALFDFLVWGCSRFPASHIMLIMSGHGYGFMGFMADSSDCGTYLMSIPGFAEALRKFRLVTNQGIDILIFDTCYMNQIEVLFEIAEVSENTAGYVILSQENPPLEGLPWPVIINGLEKDSVCLAVGAAAKGIVKAVNEMYKDGSSVFSVNFSGEYFYELKELTDRLARAVLNEEKKADGSLVSSLPVKRDSVLISYSYLLNHISETIDIKELAAEIFETLDKIILYPELNKADSLHNRGLCIYMPENQKQYLRLGNYYEQLLFCKENMWLMLIMGDN